MRMPSGSGSENMSIGVAWIGEHTPFEEAEAAREVH